MTHAWLEPWDSLDHIAAAVACNERCQKYDGKPHTTQASMAPFLSSSHEWPKLGQKNGRMPNMHLNAAYPGHVKPGTDQMSAS